MHGVRPFDPDETSVEAAVAEGEPVAIEAEATQDRRVEILDVEAVLHRLRRLVRIRDESIVGYIIKITKSLDWN